MEAEDAITQATKEAEGDIAAAPVEGGDPRGTDGRRKDGGPIPGRGDDAAAVAGGVAPEAGVEIEAEIAEAGNLFSSCIF